MSELLSETLREITPGLDDGRYVLIGPLKEGRLYLAEKAGKRFVLKTAAGAKGLEMLKREYELSIGLSHPGLAYVFTWEEDSPVGPCIVQEYVDGPSLGRWLSEKPSLRERRRVFGELLSTVGYLHRKGIIHNDLTPENILVSRAGGALKLIDLGFADADAYAQKALGGTRGYASPELLAGAPVDARSDIYSIGCLMQDLFPGRYRGITRRCRREDAARRYPSADAVRRAMNARRWPLFAALGLLAAGLLLWPLFRKPQIVEVPVVVEVESDSLREVVDSLREVIDSHDREEAERDAALQEAKDKVEAVYKRAIPAFRKALREAGTQQEVTDAWLAFTEESRKVNYDIPAAAPEAVRPALRDYIVQRNAEILDILGKELAARTQELSATPSN